MSELVKEGHPAIKMMWKMLLHLHVIQNLIMMMHALLVVEEQPKHMDKKITTNLRTQLF